MVPAQPAFLAAFAVMAVVAIAICAALYGLPGTPVKERLQRASRVILRLLTYPLGLVLLTVMFVCLWVSTLVNYTVRRVGGHPVSSFRLRATFDD